MFDFIRLIYGKDKCCCRLKLFGKYRWSFGGIVCPANVFFQLFRIILSFPVCLLVLWLLSNLSMVTLQLNNLTGNKNSRDSFQSLIFINETDTLKTRPNWSWEIRDEWVRGSTWLGNLKNFTSFQRNRALHVPKLVEIYISLSRAKNSKTFLLSQILLLVRLVRNFVYRLPPTRCRRGHKPEKSGAAHHHGCFWMFLKSPFCTFQGQIFKKDLFGKESATGRNLRKRMSGSAEVDSIKN